MSTKADSVRTAEEAIGGGYKVSTKAYWEPLKYRLVDPDTGLRCLISVEDDGRCGWSVSDAYWNLIVTGWAPSLGAAKSAVKRSLARLAEGKVPS